MAKNDLITNLQDDYEDNLELEEFKEDISDLKEKADHLRHIGRKNRNGKGRIEREIWQ